MWQIKLTRAMVASVMLCCGMSCAWSTSHTVSHSRSINGISARFAVRLAWEKKLKFVAVYRNDSTQTVHFRVVPPSYDARFWLGSTEKTSCIITSEPPVIDLVLKPGEEYRIPDELSGYLPDWCFQAGKYDIRFYCNVWLLPADLKQRYLSKGVTQIPWSDERLHLTIK